MLPSSKIEEASRNGFIFDAVKFKNWGGIASFLTLSSSESEELSQHCFVLDAVKFKQKLKKFRGTASL